MPNAEYASVPRRKIEDDLLSVRHSAGHSQAHFLRAVGFNEASPTALERGLLEIAQSCEVVQTESSAHGTKYVVNGDLVAPNGRTIRLRTVGIIDSDLQRPRFVTAYPAPRL